MEYKLTRDPSYQGSMKPTSNDITHWKYIRREKGKNGKWKYFYKTKEDVKKKKPQVEDEGLTQEEVQGYYDFNYDTYFNDKGTGLVLVDHVDAVIRAMDETYRDIRMIEPKTKKKVDKIINSVFNHRPTADQINKKKKQNKQWRY